MRTIILILCALFIGVHTSNAQSLKDLFSKKSVSRLASSAGLNTPLKIEGTWKYSGTAIELKTDNALKKAASEVAAVAAEEKINSYLSGFGIKPNKVKFDFKKDGSFTVKALGRNIPGSYQLSEDQKKITLSFTEMVTFTPDVNHTIDTVSLLFEADKLMEFMNYISKQTDITSLKAVNSLAQNYDGIKIGIQLEKSK